MAGNVCPVWVGYLLSSPLRKMLQDPESFLSPYVKPGMRVGDIGCAMGFFSIPMAGLVGDTGRVVCVDIQEKMLKNLKRRAAKAGVGEVMDYRLCDEASFHLASPGNPFDFMLASAVVHEVPEPGRLFQEAFEELKPGGRLLVSEPSGHVSRQTFEEEIATAEACGFRVTETLAIRRTHAVILERPAAVEGGDGNGKAEMAR